MNKLTHIENVASKFKKNGGILDRSMLETMKNSLSIIPYDYPIMKHLPT